MRDERECGHEEDEDGGAILGVTVDLSGNPDQPEEAGGLEQTYQRGRLRWERAS